MYAAFLYPGKIKWPIKHFRITFYDFYDNIYNLPLL